MCFDSIIGKPIFGNQIQFHCCSNFKGPNKPKFDYCPIRLKIENRKYSFLRGVHSKQVGVCCSSVDKTMESRILMWGHTGRCIRQTLLHGNQRCSLQMFSMVQLFFKTHGPKYYIQDHIAISHSFFFKNHALIVMETEIPFVISHGSRNMGLFFYHSAMKCIIDSVFECTHPFTNDGLLAGWPLCVSRFI